MIDPTESLYRIAALYVDPRGVYSTVPGVDVWGEERDARTYAGPHPVVAHPPCGRWGAMAPVNQARYGHVVGDDGGCFAAALASVRRWGGVLEHPGGTRAWPAHDLVRPVKGRWREWAGGWVAEVYQAHYGHAARKRTWLYAVTETEPGSLRWGPPPPVTAWVSTDRPRAELAAKGIRQLGKREAAATPREFADALIAIALGAP